ncbi:MAG: MBL fold metallo-hydrolase, partial [Parachlamydiaceae bacterium]|nr:MBL fold metallo-hydrolase [Parachlamydiaceae bacterium]
LKACDYLYLESNHQPDMVHASSRPPKIKQRILSNTGHLSNESCGQLLTQIHHPKLKHVHLAHLSSECNHPETALKIVENILNQHNIKLDLCVAPQHSISRIIHF